MRVVTDQSAFRTATADAPATRRHNDTGEPSMQTTRNGCNTT
jgi:hypothetical protein